MKDTNPVELSISVVSHGQIELVAKLLQDIQDHCTSLPMEVILTLNVEESLPDGLLDMPFHLRVIRNFAPKGFGANHNRAFEVAQGRYFCVINPDIRFGGDPFGPLVENLSDAHIGVIAPLVLGITGEMEDSARIFPSPLRILCKAFGKCRGSDYEVGTGLVHPDWVGGMFMLFRRETYSKLGGFDERYYLYYEDVDLCARVRLQGEEVVLCPASRVVHEARRTSYRSMRYFWWHASSMLRFFLSLVYWRVLLRGRG